jgi:hypothetical protein
VTRRSIVLATAFTVVEGVAALGLLAVSVHGPDGLTIAAPLYLLAAVGLTWWTARRVGSVRGVLAVGMLALAAAPGVFMLLEGLDGLAYERRIAATRVSDVRDEPILSASGRPIGVRVSYTVSVPKRGYFGILPSIHSRDARAERLWLSAARWTVDGRSEPTMFEPGKRHAMRVELYPSIFAISRGGPCLVSPNAPPLPDTIVRAPLRLMILETTYGAVYRGAREEVTRESYDLAELYRGVLAEGLARCPGS